MTGLILADESLALSGSLALILVLVFVACSLISIIPCWILSSKGYDGSAMFGMFMLSFFCSWPIGLCVALIMPDKRHLQGHQPIHRRRPPRVKTKRQRQLHAGMTHAQSQGTRSAPSTQALLPGFIRCPRCGEQANPSLPACWSCKLPFRSAQSTPSEVPSMPDQSASDNGEGPTWTGAEDDARVAIEAVADATPVIQPQAIEAHMEADADAITKVGAVVSSDAPMEEIKVRCKACNKRYRGPLATIHRLRACPRCKVSPFETEVLPL